jgi:hypothetical protein
MSIVHKQISVVDASPAMAVAKFALPTATAAPERKHYIPKRQITNHYIVVGVKNIFEIIVCAMKNYLMACTF